MDISRVSPKNDVIGAGHYGCHGDRTPTRVPGQQEDTTGGSNGRRADFHLENEMRVFWLSYLPILAADVL